MIEMRELYPVLRKIVDEKNYNVNVVTTHDSITVSVLKKKKQKRFTSDNARLLVGQLSSYLSL